MICHDITFVAILYIRPIEQYVATYVFTTVIKYFTTSQNLFVFDNCSFVELPNLSLFVKDMYR